MISAYVHRRVQLRLLRLRYLEWTRDAHRLHYRYGGEPYGMLLPVVPRALRSHACLQEDLGKADL